MEPLSHHQAGFLPIMTVHSLGLQHITEHVNSNQCKVSPSRETCDVPHERPASCVHMLNSSSKSCPGVLAGVST